MSKDKSTVGLMMDKNGYELLQVKLKCQPKERRKFFEECCNFTMTHPETKMAIYYWEDLRWYGDNENVNFLEVFLEQLSDKFFWFIRTCESQEDIVMLGSLCEDPFEMELIAKILFNK